MKETKTIEIIKNGYEIMVENVRCKVITQASKGEHKEVVNIEPAVGDKWQKYISLSKLIDGTQTYEINERRETSTKLYKLTIDEQNEIDALQAKIDAIIENAKKRYVKPIDMNKVDITKLTKEQKAILIAQLEAQRDALRAELNED